MHYIQKTDFKKPFEIKYIYNWALLCIMLIFFMFFYLLQIAALMDGDNILSCFIIHKYFAGNLLL